MTEDSENSTFDKLSDELGRTKIQVEKLTLELKEANSKLHQLVYRDGLSGLYNRRYFQEMTRKELERSLRYASPFSLLLFDLDAFAEINQTYGKANGDLVLMNIARIVQQEVRPSDIAARYGDDKFAVILPETDLPGLKTFAERLSRSVQETATIIAGQEVRTTVSIGGSTFTPGTPRTDKHDLIQTTEQALADAKKQGSTRIKIAEST